MGAQGEDVQLSPAARECIPFSIEAKNQEKLNVWSALDQCQANAPIGAAPLVVMKKNGREPHAVLPWKTFLNLIRKTPIQDADKDAQQLIRMSDALRAIAKTLSGKVDVTALESKVAGRLSAFSLSNTAYLTVCFLNLVRTKSVFDPLHITRHICVRAMRAAHAQNFI